MENQVPSLRERFKRASSARAQKEAANSTSRLFQDADEQDAFLLTHTIACLETFRDTPSLEARDFLVSLIAPLKAPIRLISAIRDYTWEKDTYAYVSLADIEQHRQEEVKKALDDFWTTEYEDIYNRYRDTKNHIQRFRQAVERWRGQNVPYDPDRHEQPEYNQVIEHFKTTYPAIFEQLGLNADRLYGRHGFDTLFETVRDHDHIPAVTKTSILAYLQQQDNNAQTKRREDQKIYERYRDDFQGNTVFFIQDNHGKPVEFMAESYEAAQVKGFYESIEYKARTDKVSVSRFMRAASGITGTHGYHRALLTCLSDYETAAKQRDRWMEAAAFNAAYDLFAKYILRRRDAKRAYENGREERAKWSAKMRKARKALDAGIARPFLRRKIEAASVYQSIHACLEAARSGDLSGWDAMKMVIKTMTVEHTANQNIRHDSLQPLGVQLLAAIEEDHGKAAALKQAKEAATAQTLDALKPITLDEIWRGMRPDLTKQDWEKFNHEQFKKAAAWARSNPHYVTLKKLPKDTSEPPLMELDPANGPFETGSDWAEANPTLISLISMVEDDQHYKYNTEKSMRSRLIRLYNQQHHGSQEYHITYFNAHYNSTEIRSLLSIPSPETPLCDELSITPAGTALIAPFPPDSAEWERDMYGEPVARITVYRVALKPVNISHSNTLRDYVCELLKLVEGVKPAYESPKRVDEGYSRNFAWQNRNFFSDYNRDGEKLSYDHGYAKIRDDGWVELNAKLDLDDVMRLYTLLESALKPTRPMAHALASSIIAEERGVIQKPNWDYCDGDRGHHIPDTEKGLWPRDNVAGILPVALRDVLISVALGESNDAELALQIMAVAKGTLTGRIPDFSGRFATYDRLLEEANTMKEHSGHVAKIEWNKALEARIKEITTFLTGGNGTANPLSPLMQLKTLRPMLGPLREEFRRIAEAGELEWHERMYTLSSDEPRKSKIPLSLDAFDKAEDQRQAELRKHHVLTDIIAGRMPQPEVEDMTPEERLLHQRRVATISNVGFASSEVERALDRIVITEQRRAPEWYEDRVEGIHVGASYRIRSAGSPAPRYAMPDSLAHFLRQRHDVDQEMQAGSLEPSLRRLIGGPR